MALPVIERAGDDRHRAVGIEADRALFDGHRRGGLDVTGEPKPAQFAGALARAPTLLETFDVGARQRVLEQAGKIAAVVRHTRGRLERHLARLDEIAPPQFEAVDADLGGGIVHRAFHAEGTFRPPGAAIGRHQRGVGEHALGGDFEQRRAVHADDVLHQVEGRQQRTEGRAIAAQIAVAGEPQRLDHPVLVEGHFDRHVVIAAVMVRHEAAGTFVGPLDRPTQRAGAMQDADIFRIGCRLHAERAADIAGEHAHFGGRGAEDVRHHVLEPEHALAARMQRPLFGRGVELADGRARLDRIHHQALIDQRQFHHMRRLGEGLSDLVLVAIVIVEREIARHVIPDLRCAGFRRVARRHHRRQRLDVERDRFGRVLGLRDRLGDHAGDRVADVTHLVAAQRRPRRIADRRAIATLERQIAFEPAIGGKIGRGQDREHARHGLGGGGIDAADDAMRVAAAHHHRIGLARPVDVVGVAAFAAHQRRILGAQHGLADAEFHQRKRVFGGLIVHAGLLQVVIRENIK